jgi:hypothetical protein
MTKKSVLITTLVASIILFFSVSLYARQAYRSGLQLKPSQDGVGGRQLTDEIFIAVPDTVSQEKLQAIVSSSHAELLGLTGMASGVPNADYWTVDVPWAASDADVEQVRQALVSNSEIISAEVNPWVFPQ